jgi:hypothetical protein
MSTQKIDEIARAIVRELEPAIHATLSDAPPTHAPLELMAARERLEAGIARKVDIVRKRLTDMLSGGGPAMSEPAAIPERVSRNFDTLRRAFRNSDVALVSALTNDGEQAYLVCATNQGADEIEIVPFATMIDGDPYGMFRDPTDENNARRQAD